MTEVSVPVPTWKDLFPQWEYATADARAYIKTVDTLGMPRSHIVHVVIRGSDDMEIYSHAYRLQQTHRRQSLALHTPPKIGDPRQTSKMATNVAARAVLGAAIKGVDAEMQRLCPLATRTCVGRVQSDNTAVMGPVQDIVTVDMLQTSPPQLLLLHADVTRHRDTSAETKRLRQRAAPVQVECNSSAARTIPAAVHPTISTFDEWAVNSSHENHTREYDQNKDSYVVYITGRVEGPTWSRGHRDQFDMGTDIQAAAFLDSARTGTDLTGRTMYQYDTECFAAPAWPRQI